VTPSADGFERRSRGPRRQTVLQEATNLPNLIALARIGAIPFVVLLLDANSSLKDWLACGVFLVASLTDAVDGYLARSRGQVTLVGKFLDPLADKLLVMSVLIYLVQMDRVQNWLAVLLIGRELAITGLRTLAASEGLVISASRFGKRKTMFQMTGLAFLILDGSYYIYGTSVAVNFHLLGIWLVYISLGFSLFSAGHYFLMFVDTVDRNRAEIADPQPGSKAEEQRPSQDATGAATPCPPQGSSEGASPPLSSRSDNG